MTTLPSLDSIDATFVAGDHAGALAAADDLLAGEVSATELTRLAAILTDHGQNPRAADVLARLGALRPDDPQLQAEYAQLLWISGRTDDAITVVRRALERWPQLHGLYRMLGMILLTNGQHLNALMAYATALALKADDQFSAIGRACAFRLLTGQREVTVRAESVAAKFTLSGRSISVDFQHLRGLFYEPQELAALAAISPHEAVVVDVGANLGNHAVFLLHALQPRELVLFEPNPACVTVLRENLTLNFVPATEITLLEEGVGAAPGELFFNAHDDLNNGLVPVAQGRAHAVKIVTLDQRIAHADVLKIDVEGMEIQVLLGAQRLLRESRPVLFVEVQRRNASAFAHLLGEFGYEIAHRFDEPAYANIIARPLPLG